MDIKELNKQRYKKGFGKLQYLRYSKGIDKNKVKPTRLKNEAVNENKRHFEKSISEDFIKEDFANNLPTLPIEESIEKSDLVIGVVDDISENQQFSTELALYEEPEKILVQKKGFFGLGKTKWVEKKNK